MVLAMNKADKLRLQLIEDLIAQYMCWYDDMGDPEGIAESLVFTISEIINDSQINTSYSSYQFPEDIFDKGEDKDDEEPVEEPVPPKVVSWPTEADLIEESVNE